MYFLNYEYYHYNSYKSRKELLKQLNILYLFIFSDIFSQICACLILHREV